MGPVLNEPMKRLALKSREALMSRVLSDLRAGDGRNGSFLPAGVKSTVQVFLMFLSSQLGISVQKLNLDASYAWEEFRRLSAPHSRTILLDALQELPKAHSIADVDPRAVRLARRMYNVGSYYSDFFQPDRIGGVLPPAGVLAEWNLCALELLDAAEPIQDKVQTLGSILRPAMAQRRLAKEYQQTMVLPHPMPYKKKRKEENLAASPKRPPAGRVTPSAHRAK